MVGDMSLYLFCEEGKADRGSDRRKDETRESLLEELSERHCVGGVDGTS